MSNHSHTSAPPPYTLPSPSAPPPYALVQQAADPISRYWQTQTALIHARHSEERRRLREQCEIACEASVLAEGREIALKEQQIEAMLSQIPHEYNLKWTSFLASLQQWLPWR